MCCVKYTYDFTKEDGKLYLPFPSFLYTECLNISRSFNPSQLPEGFPKWEGSTEAPRDINVLRTNYSYDDCVYAGMLVKFNSPLLGKKYYNTKCLLFIIYVY